MNFSIITILLDTTTQFPLMASLFAYFTQSNFAGKIILLILLICSILAWSVIIGKLMEIKRLEQQNQRHQSVLNQSTGILSFNLTAHNAQESSPHYAVTFSALKAFARYGSVIQGKNREELDLLMGHVENAIGRSVAEKTIQYEEKMVLLGSIVTGAPFLGLLGTVWGVMDAFGAMSYGSSATLQSLAPGVSGALLTTVAGLVVAIPSVFGYNYLLQKTKLAIIELENFASTISDRIELEARSTEQD